MNNEPCFHNAARWFDKSSSSRKHTNRESFWFPTQKPDTQKLTFFFFFLSVERRRIE